MSVFPSFCDNFLLYKRLSEIACDEIFERGSVGKRDSPSADFAFRSVSNVFYNSLSICVAPRLPRGKVVLNTEFFRKKEYKVGIAYSVRNVRVYRNECFRCTYADYSRIPWS